MSSQRSNRSDTSQRSQRSNTASSARTTDQAIPEGWKIVTKETEGGKFKKVLNSIDKKGYKGGQLTYRPKRPGEATNLLEIRMKHPAREVHWKAEEHQDLNHGIRHIKKEVQYKVARKDDERFKDLYEKLINPESMFTEEYLRLHEVSLDNLKDDKAKILYKEDIDGKWIVRADHRTRAWSVKESSQEKAIEAMKKHLGEFETNYDSTSWTRNEVWKDIDHCRREFYASAKVFRKTVDEGSGKKWIFRLSRPDETTIHKAIGDHRNETAEKLRHWINSRKIEYKRKTILHAPRALSTETIRPGWAEITRRGQEGGAFAQVVDYTKQKRLEGILHYNCDDAPSSVILQWIPKDPGKPTITIHKRRKDTAVKELMERFQEKEVDINSDDSYRPLVQCKYRDRSNPRNVSGAKVFCKSKSNGLMSGSTHKVRLEHPFWGFTKSGKTVQKAVQALVDHLTDYMPVTKETFRELFNRDFDQRGAEWERLLEVDDETEGEIFTSGKKENEVEAVIALSSLIENSRSTKGTKHTFRRGLNDDASGDFTEIEVKATTEGGAFRGLLSAVANHYNKQAKVYYSRKNKNITITIKTFEDGRPRVVFKLQSSSLALAARQTKFLFDFEEVSRNDEKYSRICDMIKENPQVTNGDGFRILRKKDEDSVYNQSPCWYIRVEHPEIGFQVHGKDQADAIENMELHLKYEKFTDKKPPSRDPEWKDVFRTLQPSYGLCEVFARTTSSGQHKVKVDHPIWGIQYMRGTGSMPEIAKDLYHFLQENESKARENFVFDIPKSYFEVRNQRTRSLEHDDKYKKARDSDEKGVFRPIFSIIRRNYKDKDIDVYYCSKPRGIKILYMDQFYKIEHHSEKFENLVPKVVQVLEFRRVSKTEKEYNALHNKLRSIQNERNFLIEPKLYMKELKNEKIKVEIKENMRWKENAGKKPGKLFAVKVDHPVIGFTTYGTKEEKARAEMLDHLEYHEITKQNYTSFQAFQGRNNEAFVRQIFADLEERYGWCRLFYRKKDDKYYLKVSHELKGPQYTVEKDSASETLKTMKELLEDDKEARKHDFVFERHRNGDPRDACRIWKPITENRGTRDQRVT
ncbi:hypothetical protein ACEPAF_2956 [Sanghuangporus sanghuang]